MSAAASRRGSPFSRLTVLLVVVAGFLAFLAMLYFLSAGDTGERDNGAHAHASAKGLNGYAGLVRLLRGEGIDVTVSRSPADLETEELLVLTPPIYADAEEIGQILENRQWYGPTLVIAPKWTASGPPRNAPDEVKEKFKDGWVQLSGAFGQAWSQSLPAPYTWAHDGETLAKDDTVRWSGYGLSGTLPTPNVAYTAKSDGNEAMVTDGEGHVLAFGVVGKEGSEYYDDAHWTVFVAEPDLMNNYGLADGARAEVALAIIREAGYNDEYGVVFDTTLNGFGGAENLLTLAFRPPFLAATLCLILALLIVGWRAFLRFGPAAAQGPEIAFGKQRLVSNGAGLIVRAGRLRLLAEPYVHLAERRLAQRLGLTRHDPAAIDTALAARLPQEEPFTLRAQRLRDADTPLEILRAAQALKELEGKLAR